MVFRIVSATCLMVLLMFNPGLGYAQDPELVDIVQDGFYGGLAGALVGTAALAFTSEPDEHLDYIGIGAAVGIIAGTAYGIFSASRVFAEVEGSRVTFNFPLPEVVTVSPASPLGTGVAQIRTSLLRVRF